MDLMENQLFSFSVPTQPFPRDPALPPNGLLSLKDDTGYHLYVYFNREQAVHAIRTHHRLDPERQEHYEQALERGIFAENPPSMIHITGLEAELFASLLLLPRVLKKAGKDIVLPTPDEMRGQLVVNIPVSHLRVGGICYADDGCPHVHVVQSREQLRDVLEHYTTCLESVDGDQLEHAIANSGLAEISPEADLEIIGHAAERIGTAYLLAKRYQQYTIYKEDGEEGYTFTI